MTKMSAFIMGIGLIGNFMQASAYVGEHTDAEWAATLETAGTQRTLSQKMSKEFLLVAKGMNVSLNRNDLVESISLFDGHLGQLINGDKAALVIGNPTPEVTLINKEISDLWVAFKALLEGNMDTVRQDDGTVNLNIVKQMAADSGPLLDKSDMVVSLLQDAAKAEQAKTAGLAVNIIGRQRMLVQKMQKEAFLIGFGIDATANVQALQDTTTLFAQSHEGIVKGSPWAGIPTLTAMCAIQDMRHVTYDWNHFKHIVDEVLGSTHPVEVADKDTGVIAELGSLLYVSMVHAVYVYTHADTSTCDPRPDITPDEWVFLVSNIGNQRYLGQLVTVYFMQIANNVLVQESKVALISKMAELEINLRRLIEGSEADHVPAPPTQAITDEVLLAYRTWKMFEVELQNVVNSESATVDIITVTIIVEMSKLILEEMEIATLLYEHEAEVYAPEVHAYQIDMSGHQQMLFQKIAKAALQTKYYAEQNDVEHRDVSRKEMDESISYWRWTHDMLLKGHPDKDVNATKSLCLIWQMKYAKDEYEKLEVSALKVADGSQQEITIMADVLPVAYDAMDIAVQYYSYGLSKCDETTKWTITAEDWKAIIREIGYVRTMIEKVAAAFFWSHIRPPPAPTPAPTPAPDASSRLLASSPASSATTDVQAAQVGPLTPLQGAIQNLSSSIDALKFGSASTPAPYSQHELDAVGGLYEIFPSYKLALEGHGLELAEAEKEVADTSEATLSEAEDLMATYVHDAEMAIPGFPGARMNYVSEQAMLANKMVLLALEVKAGTLSAGSPYLATTRNKFTKIQKILLKGDGTLQKIIKQREDLKQQHEQVDNYFARFEVAVFGVASAPGALTEEQYNNVQLLLSELEKQLAFALELYSLADPIPPKVFGWTRIIYLAIILPFYICVICFGFYKGGMFVGLGSKGGRKTDSSASEKSKMFSAANTV